MARVTAAFQGWLFLVLGAGMMGVAWNSLRTGWLPCGPRRPGADITIWRHERALFYWLLFIGYNVFGFWFSSRALCLIKDSCPPLPWD